MDNKQILLNALLSIQPNAELILNKYNIPLYAFIDTLSLFSDYSLNRELNINTVKSTALTKELLPNRVRNNTKLHSYILLYSGLKYCPTCKHILPTDDFYHNNTRLDKLSSVCSSCQRNLFKNWYNNTDGYISKMHSVARRTKMRLAFPLWANSQKIREIYKNCPQGMQVDHIIPLNGALVSGLHVENNLQYLSKEDNLKKGNKYCIN